MRCPFCGHDDTQVKDSRPSDDNAAIRRRRLCPACGGRFTTFERVQLRELTVIKKAGRREPFDREKLERAIHHALRKRPVETERVERMITGIVRRLESLGENEIPSHVIGELVMQALASLDKVAYIRFASVYKNFREAKDFEALSLKEAAGGTELLWEADVNRPIRGYYNPLDCFMLDQIIEAAERNNIYLMLCAITRDLYMNTLSRVDSPEYRLAVEDARKFMRYAVARWGYSTSVAAWEYPRLTRRDRFRSSNTRSSW